MARVNVDQVALSDARYQTLGRLLGTGKHDALGRMIFVWNECQERETYELSSLILDSIFDRDGAGDLLEKAELARKGTNGSYYIRGAKGRVEWLKSMREIGRAHGYKGAEHGSKGGRPKTPLGGAVGGEDANPPPAPAPAPALLPETTSVNPAPAVLTKTVTPRDPNKPTPSELDSFFERWWVEGPAPRKVQKANARKAFHRKAPKHRAELEPWFNRLMELTKRRWKEWQEREPSLRPHPATFLNAEEF